MKKTIQEEGFGLVIAIVVVAVLALGGATAYNIVHKEEVKTDTKAEVTVDTDEADRQAAEVKSKVKVKLTELKNVLDSASLSAEAKADASAEIISDIKTSIASVSGDISAEVRAELVNMNDEVEEIEVSIKSNANNVKTSIQGAIDRLNATTSNNYVNVNVDSSGSVSY